MVTSTSSAYLYLSLSSFAGSDLLNSLWASLIAAVNSAPAKKSPALETVAVLLALQYIGSCMKPLSGPEEDCQGEFQEGSANYTVQYTRGSLT